MALKTQSAQCANFVKKLLKQHYPAIKFSVKSDNFSMGNAVDISWNLGPTSEEVDSLVRKFQYGHFDGMIDCYEYSNSRNDIPQAKYVQTSREYRTEEEITNDKLKWRDPARRDLWKEEKTLYHIIAKDLCTAMRIEYKGLNERVPELYQHMIRGYAYGGTFQNLVYQLLRPTPLMTGYHGVRHKRAESGEIISNSFEVF